METRPPLWMAASILALGLVAPSAAHAAHLEGTVRDAASGAPLAGAFVALRHGHAVIRWQTARTDEHGRFQFDVLDGDVSLSVSADARETLALSFASVPTAPLEVRLAPEVSVHGVVIDANGLPHRGAKLVYMPLTPGGLRPSTFGRVDRNGAYVVRGLSLTTSYRVFVELPGCGPLLLRDVTGARLAAEGDQQTVVASCR